uniref:Transketolase N-terminal domain-containing protein n=2 Tax=Hucho hucho TaxID=62062 RepID=A0A4W5MFZ0_9TELE
AGFVKEADLVNLRKLDSDLEGHPTPKLEFVDVATGSLGQGLGAACGMAYTGKHFDKSSYRVYCMMGDGECSEGAVWEAMAFGSHYNLDNLVAIIDVNRLGQSEAAPLKHNMDVYHKRCEAFGWNTYVVDGHDVEALCKALWQAQQVKGKPTMILAKTFKGRGLKGRAEYWGSRGESTGEAGERIHLWGHPDWHSSLKAPLQCLRCDNRPGFDPRLCRSWL